MPNVETVVRWDFDVDINNITAVRDQVDAALVDTATVKLVIDLADLTFVDSLGLGLLVYAHNASEQHGIAFALRHVPPFTLEMLRHTSLDHVFTIE